MTGACRTERTAIQWKPRARFQNGIASIRTFIETLLAHEGRRIKRSDEDLENPNGPNFEIWLSASNAKFDSVTPALIDSGIRLLGSDSNLTFASCDSYFEFGCQFQNVLAKSEASFREGFNR
jgi:hypothetical protein